MDFPISRTRFTLDEYANQSVYGHAVYKKDGVRVKIEIQAPGSEAWDHEPYKTWYIISINYKGPKEHLLFGLNEPAETYQTLECFNKTFGNKVRKAVREATKEQHDKMLAMEKLYFYLLNT